MMSTLREFIARRTEPDGKVLGLLLEYFNPTPIQIKEILDELCDKSHPNFLLWDFYRFVNGHPGMKLQQKPDLCFTTKGLIVKALYVKPPNTQLRDNEYLELAEWLFRQFKDSNGKIDPVFGQWFRRLRRLLQDGSLDIYLDRCADDEFRSFVLLGEAHTQQSEIDKLIELTQINDPDQKTIDQIKYLRNALIPKIGQEAVMEIFRNNAPQLIIDLY